MEVTCKKYNKKIVIKKNELKEDYTGECSPLGQYVKGAAAQNAWIKNTSNEAEQFMRVFVDQLSKVDMAIRGEKSKGSGLLDTKYKGLIEKLSHKYPDFNRNGIELIAEEYDEELVKKTFEVLNSIDNKKLVFHAIRILSEMAMVYNSPSIYERMLELLKKNSNDNKALSKILYDGRFEFMLDSYIDKALKDYEKR